MTSSTRKWCIQFVKCKGCKLDSECAVRVSDGHPYIRDGVIIDPWAIRTTAMIERELSTMQSIEN